MTIKPFLMFQERAEEAVRYYTSIFPNSEIGEITHFTEKEIEINMRLPEEYRVGPAGMVKIIEFSLNGHDFWAGNGGGYFHFTDGTSLHVECSTQEELDRIWEGLCDGGKIQECGWVTDRFGYAWQVYPENAKRYMSDPDQEKADRVSTAILNAKKIDFDMIEKAYRGDE